MRRPLRNDYKIWQVILGLLTELGAVSAFVILGFIISLLVLR